MDDAPDQDRDELLARCAEALGVLASADAYAERARFAARGEVQRETSDRIAELLVCNELAAFDDEEDDGEDDALAERIERARPMLERALALVQSWPYGAPPPELLVELAQAALAALEMELGLHTERSN